MFCYGILLYNGNKNYRLDHIFFSVVIWSWLLFFLSKKMCWKIGGVLAIYTEFTRVKCLWVVLYVKACYDKPHISHLHRKCNVVYPIWLELSLYLMLSLNLLEASVVVEAMFTVSFKEESENYVRIIAIQHQFFQFMVVHMTRKWNNCGEKPL